MKDNIVQQLERLKAKLPEGFEINVEFSCESSTSSIYATHATALTPPLVWRDRQWRSTAL